jgi:alkylhydroperoxidase family enzyme
MARLPYVVPEKASSEVKRTLAQLPTPLNVFKMMAHAETSFRPLVQLGSSILARQQLSPVLRELAILRVMRLSACSYEWLQHVSLALLVGATRKQVDALEKGDVGAACFDEGERLVLEFATELVRETRCSDAVFNRMRRRFSPREIVELVVAIGYYMMIARLVETTAVDVEPPSEQVASRLRKLEPR